MQRQTTQFITAPESEILYRIDRLKKQMENNAMQAVFLSHKPDIHYFSGTSQDCYLYIHLDHDPILFVKRYFPRAEKESTLKNIIPIRSIKEIPEKILEISKTLPGNCGLAFDVVPVRDFNFLQRLFKPTELVDCTGLITECRQIKSGYEIDLIKEAAELSRKTFAYIEKNIRSGISEMEFAGEYETYARKLGHSGILLNRHYRAAGYPFHLLSGKSGGLPGAVDTPCSGTGTSAAHPSGAGPKLIQANEPVLIDFGTILNGYHMDETRMFSIGKTDQKAMDASLAAIEILDAIFSWIKPGMTMGEVFQASVNLANKLGFKDQYLGIPGLKCSFIGHGIGLELVESPVISKGKKETFKPGMVFAVEPKFIFKNQFAAGIESVIHVTEKGAQYLSVTSHKIFNTAL